MKITFIYENGADVEDTSLTIEDTAPIPNIGDTIIYYGDEFSISAKVIKKVFNLITTNSKLIKEFAKTVNISLYIDKPIIYV